MPIGLLSKVGLSAGYIYSALFGIVRLCGCTGTNCTGSTVEQKWTTTYR